MREEQPNNKKVVKQRSESEEPVRKLFKSLSPIVKRLKKVPKKSKKVLGSEVKLNKKREKMLFQKFCKKNNSKKSYFFSPTNQVSLQYKALLQLSNPTKNPFLPLLPQATSRKNLNN